MSYLILILVFIGGFCSGAILVPEWLRMKELEDKINSRK